MKQLRTILPLLSLFLLLQACTREITADYPTPPDELVVEGHIENGKPPFVILTRTIPFYGTLDTNTLRNYFVKGAVVKVSDGVKTVTLDEINVNGYNIYIGTQMLGEIGKTYKLTIDINGKSYEASTSILEPIPVDSMKFSPLVGKRDSLGYLKVFFSEPAQVGNYYRFFTCRKTVDSVDLYFTNTLTFGGSSFDDALVNGKNFDFELPRGFIQGREEKDEEIGKFKKGDTIILKWCTIDYKFFRFVKTLDVAIGSQGSPFANPSSVTGNIKGALGNWGGYGAYYDTIVAR